MSKQTNKPPGNYTSFRQKYYPFFWFVAAADETLLLQCPAPEQDKQAGIGMAIICTTIAAILSSYYAVSSLFEFWYVNILLALFWGLIIFNLDRFMVGSMRKDKQKKIGKELLVACPRIVLACLIATLISKPLEVKIFAHQITGRLMSFNYEQTNREIQRPAINLAQRKAERDTMGKDLDVIEKKGRDVNNDPAYLAAKNSYTDCLRDQTILDRKIEEKRLAKQQLLNAVTDENPHEQALRNIRGEIAALVNRRNTLGCSIKKRAMDKRAEEYLLAQAKRISSAQKAQEAIDSAVNADDRELAAATKTAAKNVADANDIFGQLRVLDDLKGKEPIMFWAGLLVTALFFVLEIAPIMVKILSPRGEYDSLLYLAEQQAFDREEAGEAESNEEMLFRKNVAFRIAEDITQIDEKVKLRVQDTILNAQAEMAEKIVLAWQLQEEAELQDNPPEYLKNKVMPKH